MQSGSLFNDDRQRNAENGSSFRLDIYVHRDDRNLVVLVLLNDLDVTQFGADSFGGAANISLYDSTSYDTLWEASSLYGTEVELVLDGSTVTGSGDFHPQGDIAATPVPGQLVANC